MTPQDKSAPREWWIIVDVEPEGDAEGYAYAHPCLHEHPLEIHVIEHSAYAALQAECERLKAAVEEVEGRRDELIQDLRDHSTWWKQTREERDQWKQMAEEMAGALNEGLRYFEKTYKYANDNADTYDREWAAAHPGVFSGFFQNFWRASEQHILMCMSGFKVKRAELLAKFAKLKEQMK